VSKILSECDIDGIERLALAHKDANVDAWNVLRLIAEVRRLRQGRDERLEAVLRLNRPPTDWSERFRELVAENRYLRQERDNLLADVRTVTRRLMEIGGEVAE